MAQEPYSSLLFLCSGNYYRSRFAEIYFNQVAHRSGLKWRAYSRGLKPTFSGNPGPIAVVAAIRLMKKGIFTLQYLRYPVRAQNTDFTHSNLVIALKETEHRPFMEEQFKQWSNSITYWEVHDIDVDPPSITLPLLEDQIMTLTQNLQNGVFSNQRNN